MATQEVRRTTSASPAAVFAVLADGWLYAAWVVGASRVRSVDAAWPKPGARIHHSFGVWPVLINDISEVEINEGPHRLVLRARGRPLGAAVVVIRVDAWGTGSLITMTEDAVAGPGRLVPQPVRQLVMSVRNREALRRLALLAEGSARGAAGTT